MSDSFAGSLTKPSHSSPIFGNGRFGSGHATCHRGRIGSDNRNGVRRNGGVRQVRFHGCLSDDVGTFTIQQDKPLNSFLNFDRIFDFLLSVGTPMVRWSLMRECREIKKGLRRADFRGGWLRRNEARVR